MTEVGDGGRHDPRSAETFWPFLGAVLGLKSEDERARLIATGLPALVPCSMGGVALHDGAESTWTLFATANGRALDSASARALLEGLEPLLLETFRRSSVLIATPDGEASDSHTPTSVRELGTAVLMLVPILTLHHQIGVLLIGTDGSEPVAREHEQLLLTLAVHLALGIENLRLTRTLKVARDQLEVRVSERTAELRAALEEVSELKNRLQAENLYLQEEIKTQHNFEEIIGESEAIAEVLRAVELVASTDANVLITGETGTGKELVARAIHSLSSRKDQPVIKVNCASVPKELFESEFFGHVRGAFTGALRNRAGRFQLADEGILFLDEVGEIPIDLQSKLLRVLQEGDYERIGEERTRHVDVRVIAATNRDLEREVEAGRFRRDLFYRLNVFPIEVAPLRERRRDIPLLAAHYLRLAALRVNRPEPALTEQALSRLVAYDWPGNIRELQNVIERAVITSPDGRLHPDLPVRGPTERRDEDPPPSTSPEVGGVLTEEQMGERERENVLAALEQTNWRIAGSRGAADLLGINPATLTSRIKKMGLQRPS